MPRWAFCSRFFSCLDGWWQRCFSTDSDAIKNTWLLNIWSKTSKEWLNCTVRSPDHRFQLHFSLISSVFALLNILWFVFLSLQFAVTREVPCVLKGPFLLHFSLTFLTSACSFIQFLWTRGHSRWETSSSTAWAMAGGRTPTSQLEHSSSQVVKAGQCSSWQY